MGLVAVAPQLLQLFYTADSYNHSITSQSLQLCKRHQLHITHRVQTATNANLLRI